MTKRILVDADLTVCPTDKAWWHWLNVMTNNYKEMPPEPNDAHIPWIDYNLATYFKEELDSLGMDGLDFFRGDSVYDLLYPIKGSVEVLKELSEQGYEIVFCSALKGRHSKSKYYFLQRYFPFMTGVVFTKEKFLLQCDYIIDDRNEFLNMFAGTDTTRIKMWTPYKQNVELENPEKTYCAGGWNDVKWLFNSIMKESK